MKSTVIGTARRCDRFLTSSRRTALYSTITLKSHCNESILTSSCTPPRYNPVRYPSAHTWSTITRLLASSPSPLPSTESSNGDDTTKTPSSPPPSPSPSTPLKSDDSPSEKTTSDEGPIFPWVSSTTSLPRLAQNDDLSGLSNTFRARFAKRVSVALEMGVPIWNILLTKSWEKELADNCSWAVSCLFVFVFI